MRPTERESEEEYREKENIKYGQMEEIREMPIHMKYIIMFQCSPINPLNTIPNALHEN